MKFQSCSVSAYSVDFQREHLEEIFLSWVLPVIVSSGDDGISHCPGISMCHLQICEVTTLDSLARINYIPVQLKWKRNWDFLSSSSPFFFLSTGMSLQAKQHAEKAKEILTSSIVPPYNDNTDVFKCSVELFHTLGQALLSLQKYPFASNLYR